MNREHMEQWIAALETYDREPARSMLVDGRGNMCAMGIGLSAMLNKELDVRDLRMTTLAFPAWTGISYGGPDPLNLPLKPDGSGYDSVTEANDLAHQSPWTIAQRLRETYLKEEQ
jgi:hypothetical protein